MPIDAKQALGFALPAVEAAWGPEQVILYHLGVGAGANPLDDNELEYTHEARLKVLPSFAVIPAFRATHGIGAIPGLTFNPMLLLHGEQELELHRPIPASAKISSVARVANLWDKGKAAVLELAVQSNDAQGEPLFTNTFTMFLRGEGGFGGARGPDRLSALPDRPADHVTESKTLPSQALLYRLSGDKNPLHIDPSFAKLAGFERPILHGLCSYGIACKAVVDTICAGKVEALARYRVRFAGVVFPGETLVTSMWREGHEIHLSASTKERGSPVLSNASVTLR